MSTHVSFEVPAKLRVGATNATSLGAIARSEKPVEDFATKAFVFKEVDVEARTADFVASTDTIDSHGEIVDQSSWQLNDYLKNPVVLFGHMSRELPIGKCIGLLVRNNQLECRVEFAPASMNPMAEQCWQMVKNGYLRAVSVGFMPTNGRYEVRDGEEVWVWSGCVLKEISVVPVPANPECLAKMKALLSEKGGRAVDATSQDPSWAHVGYTPRLRLEAGETVISAKGGTVRLSADGIEIRSTPALPGPEPAERKDTEMNEKELLARIAQLEAEAKAEKTTSEKALADGAARLQALEAECKALKTAATVIEKEHAQACDDRDLAKKRADEAEAKLVELEVQSLVGKKIAPAEVEEFVELRKSNKSLFEKMVGKRADMKLDERIVADEKPKGNSDLDEFTKG